MRDRAKDALPSRADEGRLRVARRVPGAHTEFDPALRVDGHGDLPQAPGVVVLSIMSTTPFGGQWAIH